MPRRLTDDEFAELMHGCWAGLYRTAYLLVGDHAEAEDLVQTALAKTYASWHRVESLESAGGYARTTLVNTAASWFRKKGWRNERPTAQLPDSPGPEVDATARPDLMTALAGLPPGQRAVVVLRFYEDRSVAQVAHALGVSEGTVKSQTSQALAKLRSSLGDAVIPQGAEHD